MYLNLQLLCSLSSSVSWSSVVPLVLVGVTMLISIKRKETKCWGASLIWLGAFVLSNRGVLWPLLAPTGLYGEKTSFTVMLHSLHGLWKCWNLLRWWSHSLKEDGTGLFETWQSKQTEGRAELHAGWWWSRGEDQHDHQLHLQWIQQRVQTNSFWCFHWWVQAPL